MNIMVDLDTSKRNSRSFLWHALFLALALNFTDINTIVPTMLMEAGGTPFHLGILTSIMIGGTSFMQLFFAAYLMRKNKKRLYLIAGIYLRVASLLLLGALLLYSSKWIGVSLVFTVLVIMAVFSFSGSLASVAYMDILGSTINKESRKRFFILRQTINSIGILVSAILVRYLIKVFDHPYNYSVLFLIAGSLLFIGTFGFWAVKEPAIASSNDSSLLEALKAIKLAIISDQNLRCYLLLINTSGLGLAVFPFFIALARQRFGLTSEVIGNYLLLQIVGMIGANLVMNLIAKGERYKGILYSFVLIGGLLPLAALFLSDYQSVYMIIFLFSGIALSSYRISIPGILIEISDDKNRTLYAGLSGAGSITTVIFPLLAGYFIEIFGFGKVFTISTFIILSGFYFAFKLRCSRLEKTEL